VCVMCGCMMCVCVLMPYDVCMCSDACVRGVCVSDAI